MFQYSSFLFSVWFFFIILLIKNGMSSHIPWHSPSLKTTKPKSTHALLLLALLQLAAAARATIETHNYVFHLCLRHQFSIFDMPTDGVDWSLPAIIRPRSPFAELSSARLGYPTHPSFLYV